MMATEEEQGRGERQRSLKGGMRACKRRNDIREWLLPQCALLPIELSRCFAASSFLPAPDLVYPSLDTPLDSLLTPAFPFSDSRLLSSLICPPLPLSPTSPLPAGRNFVRAALLGLVATFAGVLLFSAPEYLSQWAKIKLPDVLMMPGVQVGPKGFVFRVEGSAFRVEGSAFRVEGSGSGWRVQGSGDQLHPGIRAL